MPTVSGTADLEAQQNKKTAATSDSRFPDHRKQSGAQLSMSSAISDRSVSFARGATPAPATFP